MLVPSVWEDWEEAEPTRKFVSLGERNKVTRARVMDRLNMLECWGGSLLRRDMKPDWIKIPLMAQELGVSVKTIYNWISAGKLFMPRQGYVSQFDAYEVWLEQRLLRSMYSSVLAVQGIKRGSNGQFKKRNIWVDESGG